ncbi:hypothetical protein [Rhizobium sp. BK176]|uniref:hypothetical protein n=1 Tax=Rhizobium sp. BK176 TaxID=2587071 RepID=UPI00216838CE|nr:hypothetical protein [Rhizobium sp. BK176]MCS4089686.1 hypothetical protein [Rhizobium sp. BK176]
MGRWIDWRITEDLTSAEIGALSQAVDGPLRQALPSVVKQITDSRPAAPNLAARLAFHYKDKGTAEYAADPRTVSVSATEIRVEGSDDPRGLDFSYGEGEHSGHTVGFQDYVSFGVLAAASQVSGKVELTRGDDMDADYVKHILRRFEDAGKPIRPQPNFIANLAV